MIKSILAEALNEQKYHSSILTTNHLLALSTPQKLKKNAYSRCMHDQRNDKKYEVEKVRDGVRAVHS